MFSCKLPERFSSGTLRNEAGGNSTQGNLKRAILYHNVFYHNAELLYRTVPRHHVNGKPIRTYTERFQIEPFRSPRVNIALYEMWANSHLYCRWIRLRWDGFFSFERKKKVTRVAWTKYSVLCKCWSWRSTKGLGSTFASLLCYHG